MNIHEVAKSGKPFTNPDIIGAWMVVYFGHKAGLVHRDNPSDFHDMTWVLENCSPHNLDWFDVEDFLRTDWEIVEV